MPETHKKTPFLTRINSSPILGDGAMGTELYARGVFINRCYDELNITQPAYIEEIHRAYIAAGAELIETNTFSASPILLREYGLEDKTEDINLRGVEIARAACADAEKPVYIAGSIGPTHLGIEKDMKDTAQRVRAAFEQQAEALVRGGVDVIILETFYSLTEMRIALEAVKNICDLPVIAQCAFGGDREARHGERAHAPAYIAKELTDAGADVVGANCGVGPATLLDIVEEMAEATDIPISVFANAGTAEMHGGRLIRLGTSPEYMGEYARRYAQVGASLIGGCCGTTPEMIAEMHRFLKGITAETRAYRFVTPKTTQDVTATPLAERSAWGKALADTSRTTPLVSVELSPPRGVSVQKLVDNVRRLHEAGVDMINIPDGPRAVPRMGPFATAEIIQRETEIETLVHCCCRDRNILGLQMDLLGSCAMGIHNLMFITGDPPKVGNVHTATPVFDVDAIGLIALAQSLNHGMGLGNKKIQGQTQFVIGAGCNPGAVDLETEVERFYQKCEAGASFFFTQPVYTEQLLADFLAQTEERTDIPLFVGILPLAHRRNAEFLHNEVPGMQIPEDILARIKSHESVEKQAEEGIRIAQDMVRYALTLPRVKGIYICPPFGRYEAVLRILEVL